MHYRHPAEARRDPAHDIGTDSAVKMDQIRAACTDQASQPDDHRQVQVTPHGQAMHLRKGRRRLAQGAAARTGKQTVVTPRMQTAQQMQHLIGPAVEMAPAFDMQDSHGPRRACRVPRQHLIDLDHAHAGEGAVAGGTPFAGRAVERVIKHPGVRRG
jgi:hypothetical protein